MAKKPRTRPAGSAVPGAAAMLDAALDSMPYGFSIWDEDERLLLVNLHYAELYGLPAERIKPGMSLAEVCEITIAAGNHPGKTPTQLHKLYRERLVAAKASPGLALEK